MKFKGIGIIVIAALAVLGVFGRSDQQSVFPGRSLSAAHTVDSPFGIHNVDFPLPSSRFCACSSRIW